MPSPNHNLNFSPMGFSFRRKDFSIKYRMVRNGQVLYSVPFADIAASRLVMRGEGIVEASYQCGTLIERHGTSDTGFFVLLLDDLIEGGWRRSRYRTGVFQFLGHGIVPVLSMKRRERSWHLTTKRISAILSSPKAPEIVTIPQMQFIAVEGKGDPNQQDGEYQHAMSQLYGIAFTIKMSKMGDHRIDGYYDYVVPPLEGFWWMDVPGGMDYAHKESFRWISCIRIPDFVTQTDVHWAIEEATRKRRRISQE